MNTPYKLQNKINIYKNCVNNMFVFLAFFDETIDQMNIEWLETCKLLVLDWIWNTYLILMQQLSIKMVIKCKCLFYCFFNFNCDALIFNFIYALIFCELIWAKCAVWSSLKTSTSVLQLINDLFFKWCSSPAGTAEVVQCVLLFKIHSGTKLSSQKRAQSFGLKRFL